MISFEPSPDLLQTQKRVRYAAEHVLRPLSRKYDATEHQQATELEVLNQKAAQAVVGKESKENKESNKSSDAPTAGRAMRTIFAMEQMCWGDVGLTLARPGVGLGNAAIMAVATPEQRTKYADRFASMAITEPQAGSDSKNIATTAVRDGNEWVLNGEKIFVTDGGFSDCVVVWATLDKKAGKAGIKSFVVDKDNPGLTVARLEHKLGIRASDTATIVLDNCRVPADALLGGNAEVDTSSSAASCRPLTIPGRWWPPWHWAVRRLRWIRCASCWSRKSCTPTIRARAGTAMPSAPSCTGWRASWRRRGCWCTRRRG